jgi:cytochrome c oxidase subunit 2
VRRFWALFFLAWPIVAIVWSWLAPANKWWFHVAAQSPIGREIDNLFYLILVIVTVVFIGTNLALFYVLWKFADDGTPRKGNFSHGSHILEMVWTVTPAGVLLFLSLYQMDVWARSRMTNRFDKEAVAQPLAEVTARQFEWRIRYPAPGRRFKNKAEIDEWLMRPSRDDVYTVNELHCPASKPVVIHLRSEDVLHSFFIPDLRVKQDAVPGLVIPVSFEADKADKYDLICAELCGWGHYKMKGQITSQSDADFETYKRELAAKQAFDGVPAKTETKEGEDQ